MAVRKPREVGVLWCPNQRTARANGWSFPPTVARHLQAMTKGKRVLHLFGGMSTWGTRIDIDDTTRPHVLADAYLPPFVKDAFDVVILDPPYVAVNQQMKQQLLRGAAFIARESVIWFHTQWIAADAGMSLQRSWLVRVGDSCSVRCIQEFVLRGGEKKKPLNYFTRGPAIRYNRWLAGQTGLPFERPQRLRRAASTTKARKYA